MKAASQPASRTVSVFKNDYIGFYIRPDGNMTRVPSQKTLDDVKNTGATEAHAFYRQTFGIDVWHTDLNSPVGVTGRSQKIVNTDPDNPKLRQVFALSGGSTITIVYSLVRLDKGETDTTTSWNIIEKETDTPASYKTWGVLASATLTNRNQDLSVLRMTRHLNFGAAGHNLKGNVRLNRYLDIYASTYPYTRTTEYFTTSISTGLSRTDTNEISEAYTDSFSYANPFVAMNGYWHASIGDEMIAGIHGHSHNYSDKVAYYPESGSRLDVEHEISGKGEAFALWGFRDLFAVADSDNIPLDPISIPQNASCVGIVSN
ncbi:MAG: hypothetical protein GX111_11880 [Clostridiales bacterium]|jgi:hypothetical protein|nr:hypothetical protein [Clostridiales bacterium]